MTPVPGTPAAENTAAWTILESLPAWQVTQIPRPAGPDNDGTRNSAASQSAAMPASGDPDRGQRMMTLAAAASAGSPVAFGWIRAAGTGPVTVIVAGTGMSSSQEPAGPGRPSGPVPLGYPAGSAGRRLPPGALAGVLTKLQCWTPVAVVPDALLADLDEGPVSLEKGLKSWREPFGWLVLAVPIGKDRHQELISDVSLAQLMADRRDSPRAKQAAIRSRARHDELKQASVIGLWDIWLLAAGATPAAAARVAGMLRGSLNLRGLPFGLSGHDGQGGRLPELLGALGSAVAGTAAQPGPLTQDVLGMYDGQPPGPGTALQRAYPLQDQASGGERQAPGTYAGYCPRYDDGRGARDARDQRPEQDRTPFPEVNGSLTWAPTPAPGWAPTGPPAATWAGGPQPGSGTASGSAGKLTPDFPEPEPEFPVAASSRLLAALAMPPAREIPGVRMFLEPDFDVTPETAFTDDGDLLLPDSDDTADGTGPADMSAVGLGTVLDGSRLPSWPLRIPRSSLNRHTFVCGATGAGKSQTVRHLLESATKAGIPWLVIEPAKAEYRAMAARLPKAQVITIRPGRLGDVPVGVNPLEPAAGPGGKQFPLQAHSDLVRALFLAAFQAEEPFPQVLAGALTRCYEEAGWDLVSGEPKVPGAGFPTLADLHDAAMKVVNEIGYGPEVRDNIRGFIKVRLGSLQAGTTGRFLGSGFPVDYAKLMAGNVVLEIEDCGDDTDKAFMTGAVLIRLTEHLRMRARAEEETGDGAPPGLRHLTVIEEAHRLLRQPSEGAGAGAAAHAVEMFAGLLAEIRAYGEGIVIAEQIPSKLIPDAIKNTAVKVVHRLPAQDDRDAVGATMNLTDAQSRFLVTLKPGEAAVFTDGMDYPVLARMPDGSARERTGTAKPVSPERLIARSRPSCPPGCATAACTLREVNAAVRTAGDSRLILWAELTVVAHLTGWTMPAPGQALAADLNTMDIRHRDCAITHAVAGAVAVRVPAFSARVAAPGLAEHAAAAMRLPLNENRWLCDGSEPQWTAPSRMWGRILSDLQRRERDHPGQGPHPDTARWEDSCGKKIPGATCAEQIAVVQQRSAEARKDPRVLRTVLLGSREHSAVEHAVGANFGTPEWDGQLASALTVLDGCDWVADTYATPRQPAPAGELDPPARPGGARGSA